MPHKPGSVPHRIDSEEAVPGTAHDAMVPVDIGTIKHLRILQLIKDINQSLFEDIG